MQFSTICKVGDKWQLTKGARLAREASLTTDTVWTGWYRFNDVHVRPTGRIPVSNGFMCSPHVCLDHQGTKVIFMRAAVRMGDKPELISEEEAAHCEVRRPAHGVLFFDPINHPNDTNDTKPIMELSPEGNADLARRLITPMLAILTEDDVLTARLVQLSKRKKEIVRQVVELIEVRFDGTNVKIDGAAVRYPSQECLV